MKKILVSVLALLISISLFACSSNQSSDEQESVPEETSEDALQEEDAGEKTEAAEVVSDEPQEDADKEEVESSATNMEDVGVPVEITPEMQYESNIFLSNFIEQGIEHMSRDAWRAIDYVDFVFSYCLINENGLVSYNYENFLLPLNDVQLKLQRFFGITLSDDELATLTSPTAGFSGIEYIYDGSGYFSARALFGGTFTMVAVVDQILEYADGTQEMTFDIYNIPFERDENVGGLNVTTEDYSKSASMAANDEWFILIGGGTAKVTPKKYGERNSYELIELNCEYD